ncbi:hypothetical protein M758_UG034400 [Ceratodon purpureus]|nr:hypothetical protein M758_UG034400 [Ceratodon purpureus]
MASVACAVSPVSAQSAAATPVRYQQASVSSSSSSTSASFKVAALAFVAQQSFGSQFHGRRESFGAALSYSVVFDNGLVESRRSSRVAKCSPVRALQDGAAPLRVMISGAPASGKGTQCEMIVEQYNLAHIATGDLLRAEVAAGTDAGKLAQDYMQKGQLVPNDIVVTMVKKKLSEAPNGWLLDGYPRSLTQAEALEALNIHPQIFILLEVPDEILVQRVVGRRLDPVTGKIYHLMYSPPETPEIAARLTQREDDTEEKVKLRLKTHSANVQSVIDIYKPVMKVVDGNRPKDQVFADIKNMIMELQGEPEKVGAQVASGGL